MNSKLLFRLIVPIKPVPWKRPANKKGGGRRTPKAMKSWQDDVSLLAAYAWRGKPIDYAVELRSMSVMPRPKSLKKTPDKRIFRPTYPDGDNCMKNVGDALVKGEVLSDDRFVVVWIEVDAYGRVGEDPKTIIELRTADEKYLELFNDTE
jgi:Holliday junction resolvase RusA-like endonuclease